MKNQFLKQTCLLLIVLSCTSCSGCANKLKEYAAKAKNLTNEKTEQPQGLNPNHRFVFTDCSMTYNEQPIMIGESIHKMVKVFGPYDRVPESGIYIWDSIGILLTTYSAEDPNTDKVNNIYIYWNLDMSQDSYATNSPEVIDMRKEMVERCPKHFFQGNIMLDGTVLGRGMNIKTFLKKATLNWNNHPFPRFYRVKLETCDYSNIPIPSIEELQYRITVSIDHSDIENFVISTVYR